LLSKVLQNLGFGIEFEKEKYMTDLNDFISNNRSSMSAWIEEISTTDDSARSRNYPVVDVPDVIKVNALKWLYAAMYQNRQVLRRELAKKLTENVWEETLALLNDMGLVGDIGSTDSHSVTSEEIKPVKPIATENDDTVSTEEQEEDEEEKTNDEV